MGHFRVPKTLTFKTGLSAKSGLRKKVSFAKDVVHTIDWVSVTVIGQENTCIHARYTRSYNKHSYSAISNEFGVFRATIFLPNLWNSKLATDEEIWRLLKAV